MKCIVVGCDNEKIAAKGMCSKHYARVRRKGTTSIEYVNKGKQCKIEDCKEDAHLDGYCHTHYKRKWYHGDPLLKGVSVKGELCCIDNCQENVRTSGLCKNHYARYIYSKKIGKYSNISAFIEQMNSI